MPCSEGRGAFLVCCTYFGGTLQHVSAFRNGTTATGVRVVPLTGLLLGNARWIGDHQRPEVHRRYSGQSVGFVAKKGPHASTALRKARPR